MCAAMVGQVLMQARGAGAPLPSRDTRGYLSVGLLVVAGAWLASLLALIDRARVRERCKSNNKLVK